MPNIDARLRRIEACQSPRETFAVRGLSEEEADEKAAALRASGYTGDILKIVRVIIDPPPRTA